MTEDLSPSRPAAPPGEPAGERPWTCRAATEEDLPGLVTLFNAVFHKQAPIDQLRWKYRDNPQGPAVTWVAEDARGDLAGAYSYVARTIWIPAGGGRTAADPGVDPEVDPGAGPGADPGVDPVAGPGAGPGADPGPGFRGDRQGRSAGARQASDAMVQPEHRRQGIFVGLDRAVSTSEALRREILAFAFEGRQSVRGFRRAGWKPIGTIVRRRCVVRPSSRVAAWRGLGPLAAALLRPLDAPARRRLRARCRARLEGFEVRPVPASPGCGEEFDTLWRRARDPLDRIAVVRDASYLNWRYQHAPARRHTVLAVRRQGTLRGFAVVEAARREGNTPSGRKIEGFLVDALADDPGLGGTVLAAGLAELIDRGATSVTLGALEGHPYEDAASALGFRRSRRPRPYADQQPFIVKPLPGSGAATPAWMDPNRWFLLEGDRDDEYVSRGTPVGPSRKPRP